jgi:hypothetical protein
MEEKKKGSSKQREGEEKEWISLKNIHVTFGSLRQHQQSRSVGLFQLPGPKNDEGSNVNK